MRLAVGYTPPHLTFPVYSQCFLGFTGHAIPLALRRILRCMFPYICLSPVFSLVCTVRLLCVPSCSSKCAFLIAHFLTLSSSTVNNWWFPVCAIRSQQVSFLGSLIRYSWLCGALYIPRAFPSPCTPPFTPTLLDVSHAIPVPQETRPLQFNLYSLVFT